MDIFLSGKVLGIIEVIKSKNNKKLHVFCAINAKTLKVTFNNAVSKEDQAKATFDVKRGSFATSVTPTWAEDGKSVELGRTSNLIAGTYTVTVAGIELAEGKDTATVEVKAQKISSLEIATDNIVKDGTAKVAYIVKDQYGEKMDVNANTFAWSVVNLTDSTRIAEANPTAIKYLEIDTDGSDTTTKGVAVATNVGDVLRVTGILASDPTVKVVKEITISNVFMQDFQLGEVVLPEGKTRLNEGSTYDVELDYSSLDNYGKEMKLSASQGPAATIDGITFISSNEDVIKAAKMKTTADNKLTFTVEANKAGKATITALNNNTGATSSVEVEVFAEAKATTVEFGDFKKESIIAQDPNGTAKLAVTFFDQYGEVIEDDTYNTTTDFNVTITGPGTLAAQASLVDGYLVFNENSAAVTKGTYTLTVVNKTTGVTNSTPIVVNAAREAAQLVVVDAPKASVVQAASTTVKFKVIDQYGDDFATSSKPVELNWEKKTAGDTIIAAPSGNSGTIAAANIGNAITLTGGTTTGDQTLTFKLASTGAGAAVLDTKVVNISNVAYATAFKATVDKEKYTAGDELTLTVKAEDSNNDLFTKYNGSFASTVTVQGDIAVVNTAKTYNRLLTFVDGVATVKVPVTTAGDGSIKINFDQGNGAADVFVDTDLATKVFEVKVAEVSKVSIDNTKGNKGIVITAEDEFGNKVEAFEGNKVVKVTKYEDGSEVGKKISGDDFDTAKEAIGVFTNGVSASLNLGENTATNDVIEVEVDGFTGTFTVQ